MIFSQTWVYSPQPVGFFDLSEESYVLVSLAKS